MAAAKTKPSGTVGRPSHSILTIDLGAIAANYRDVRGRLAGAACAAADDHIIEFQAVHSGAGNQSSTTERMWLSFPGKT